MVAAPVQEQLIVGCTRSSRQFFPSLPKGGDTQSRVGSGRRATPKTTLDSDARLPNPRITSESVEAEPRHVHD